MNFLFDPQKATNYNRTEGELELFLLFCVSVAGKPANFIAKALDKFLSFGQGNTPFERIRDISSRHQIVESLRKSGLGQYTKLNYLFVELAFSGIDLRTCTLEDLEKYKWVSAKTSRYFLLHSRPKQKLICPDRHVRRRLEKLGYTLPTTFNRKNTPAWDAMFTQLCESYGKDNADVDLDWWNEDAISGAKKTSLKTSAQPVYNNQP